MHRLFTFGCSFTKYYWPSWSDILGKEFDYYENWGVVGIGNRGIAERISECHVRQTFGPDDTVVVQWSDFARHDWMRTSLRDGDDTFWRTRGNIFSESNANVFSPVWIHKFWDEKAYYIHTLNTILLTQGFLESTGCKWVMTSINDLSDTGIIGSSGDTVSVWSDEHGMIDYREKIWNRNQDRWIMPMNNFRKKHPDLWWNFESYKGIGFTEQHFSIEHNALFVDEVKKHLGIPLGLTEDQQTLVNEIIQIKADSKCYADFLDGVNSTAWGKTTTHCGN